MEDNPFPTPSLDKPSKKRRRFISLFFAIVFILLLIFLGSKFLGNSKSGEESSIIPTPSEFVIPTDTPIPTTSETPTVTPKPSKAPTSTPKPTSNPVDKATGLDRSKLSVEVQNGSGEAGVAGKGAGILKDLGYNVTSTGNADNFDYSNVTVKVKSSKSDFLSLLKKDLGSDYTIGASSSDLSASSSADALVIIGK